MKSEQKEKALNLCHRVYRNISLYPSSIHTEYALNSITKIRYKIQFGALNLDDVILIGYMIDPLVLTVKEREWTNSIVQDLDELQAILWAIPSVVKEYNARYNIDEV